MSMKGCRPPPFNLPCSTQSHSHRGTLCCMLTTARSHANRACGGATFAAKPSSAPPLSNSLMSVARARSWFPTTQLSSGLAEPGEGDSRAASGAHSATSRPVPSSSRALQLRCSRSSDVAPVCRATVRAALFDVNAAEKSQRAGPGRLPSSRSEGPCGSCCSGASKSARVGPSRRSSLHRRRRN